MITDYQIIAVRHERIDSVVLWNGHIWFSQKQLEILFHVNKAKIRRMISKLSDSMCIYSHYKAFSMLRKRYQGDRLLDVIYQIKCYDEVVVKALGDQDKIADTNTFINIIGQIENEARP